MKTWGAVKLQKLKSYSIVGVPAGTAPKNVMRIEMASNLNKKKQN